MNRGYYTNAYSSNIPSNPVTWNDKTSKTETGYWLCTTGASDQNSSLNIYDFGGNLGEWSLGRYSASFNPCVIRGDYFRYSGYATGMSLTSTGSASYYISARPSLFL
jgi:formylglycine-generating enzyme required for sulfatase activity